MHACEGYVLRSPVFRRPVSSGGTAQIGEILRWEQPGPSSGQQPGPSSEPQPEPSSEEQPRLKRNLKSKFELPVRQLRPRMCKSESSQLEIAANIVLESSIYYPGLEASNERPINLVEIIEEISCRANTERSFLFQIRTSDVEEWIDISCRVGDVRPILQIMKADNLQGFKNIIGD